MSDNHKRTDLDDLQTRLDGAKKGPIDPTRVENNKNNEKGGALSLAFRVGVELISAVAVGTAIGWGLDKWLDTRPWLMLVFIILGGAAGTMNVYRMASGYGYAVGYQKDNSDAGDKNNPGGD
jgi:ATP synthase protein I